MKAYHNDPAVKEMYLSRVRAHRVADELIKGRYWEGGKGCAVGCTIHGSKHARYETELGIQETLARLEDGIFEGLANGDAQAWPEAFLDAIPIGADLSMVWPRFAHWLLVDPEHGVIRFAGKSASIVKAVAALYQRWIDGSKPSAEEWDSAAESAESAERAAWAESAESAARAASAASAAWAAWAAWAASAAWAESAASAASAAWAAWAAWAESQKAQSVKLLQLLREAL